MNAQLSVDKAETATNTSTKYRSKNERTYVYTPGSLWSHLRCGLGTLAVIVIPPLIPGITGQELIMDTWGPL
jgi:hypothetical protein